MNNKIENDYNKVKVIYRLKPNNTADNYLEYNIINNCIYINSLKNDIIKANCDMIFDINTTQEYIYNNIYSNISENILNSNNLFMCYGETNSGKTYTIIGDGNIIRKMGR